MRQLNVAPLCGAHIRTVINAITGNCCYKNFYQHTFFPKCLCLSLASLCGIPPPSTLQRMQAHSTPDGVVQVVKMLRHRPADWAACVATARVQFDKYFNHKVRGGEGRGGEGERGGEGGGRGEGGEGVSTAAG